MIGRNVRTPARTLALPLQMLMVVAVLATLLTAGGGRAEAWFDHRCDKHPRTCQKVESWANIKRHQFKAGDLGRTPDRRIRPLREYYKHAWIKKYGRAVAANAESRSMRLEYPSAPGAQTPYGWCFGWSDCFGFFVDAANCAAHPVATVICLTSDVLDDGIGRPEKAELICAGAVLITSGGNPVAVGRGAAGCYWTWLGWQLFG